MLNMCFGNKHFMILHMYVCVCVCVCVCVYGPTVEISGLPVLYLRNPSS